MAWETVPKETLGVGTWRLSMTGARFSLPKIQVPKSFALLGNVWTLKDYYHNPDSGTLVVVLEWKEYDTVAVEIPGTQGKAATSMQVRVQTNKNTAQAEVVAIPAAAIVLAVAAVFGVVAYFNLDKVEKLVDNPAVSLLVVAVAVVAVALVVKGLRT